LLLLCTRPHFRLDPDATLRARVRAEEEFQIDAITALDQLGADRQLGRELDPEPDRGEEASGLWGGVEGGRERLGKPVLLGVATGGASVPPEALEEGGAVGSRAERGVVAVD